MARLNGKFYALTNKHEREIIQIRDLMGCTYKEIAEAYGCSAATVSNIVRCRETVFRNIETGPGLIRYPLFAMIEIGPGEAVFADPQVQPTRRYDEDPDNPNNYY